MGITGTSLSTFITYVTLFVIITVYASLQKDIKDSWFLPGKETFINIWPYIKLALPTTMMICLEWWAFEVLTLMAGFISIDAIAS